MSAGRELRVGMTKHEKMIVTAYTGVLMVPMNEFHKWVEEYLGYPVWTHDLAKQEFWDDLSKKVRDEFVRLCEGGKDE